MRFKSAILVLAAGGSERLGRPKQLVQFNKDTLLQYALNQVKSARVGDIFLVLGANAEIITDRHILTDINVLINDDWKSGIAGSITFGLNHIIKDNRYEKVIIVLADQPKLKATHLKDLIRKYKKSEASIIVSKYEDEFGPPSLFTRQHFISLLELKGDQGAKEFVKNNLDKTEFIDFPEGNYDINEAQDLRYLIEEN